MRKLIICMLVLSGILIAQNYKVDMSKVNDGKYEGDYRKMVVNVSVVNHKITEIKLVKDPSMGFAKKKANIAFQKMIEKNDVEVDAQTSATLKQLVYNALTQNKQVK